MCAHLELGLGMAGFTIPCNSLTRSLKDRWNLNQIMSMVKRFDAAIVPLNAVDEEEMISAESNERRAATKSDL